MAELVLKKYANESLFAVNFSVKFVWAGVLFFLGITAMSIFRKWNEYGRK